MASVWGELRRRNVFKVAVAYAIVVWVLVEVAATVFPILQLPEWTVTLVTMLLLLGFPVALFLSWAYELTPEGIKPAHEVKQSESITHLTGRKLDFIIIGVMVLAIGVLVIDNYVLVDESTKQPAPISDDSQVDAEKSIAVLPFVNMSADPEQEYFSDGMAEEILNGLAQVRGLRVVARTSAFSFKGQNIDIRHVGETLNVNHVLEGSVRKVGDRLRITAQLVSVDDGYHLWSETYDRQMNDVFAIQEEIARAVVSELQVTLGLADETSLVRQGTTNTEAYNWYLRGSYYIERQTPEAFDKAIESYSQAIELDPEFAGGYGGLAYGLAYGADFTPYLQVAERVRENYRRALVIDENQTHALLAKAVDAVLTDYDFVAAEQAIRRALTVSVNKTLVTDAYWWLILQGQRRFDEALEFLAVAESADPLSSLVKQGIGFNLAWRGDHQASLPYLEAAIDLNPNDFFSVWMLSAGYIELGRLEEAESTIEQLEALTGPEAFSLLAWTMLHIAREDGNRAQQVLARMIASHDAGNYAPMLVPSIGIVYTHLGVIEEAIVWFERATETPNPFGMLPAQMFYDNSDLWHHPRFQSLMKKMNLDDASVAAAKAAVASQ